MNEEDFKALQEAMGSMQQKFDELAQRVSVIEKYIEFKPSKSIPVTKQLVPTSEKSELPIEKTPAFKAVVEQAKSTNESESLENRIGQYWLNRLGIVSLVIGIVLLILYSFQYFNAPLKLFTSFCIATGLIIFGQKISKKVQESWYGYSFVAAGWALNYFTVFAMYFVPDLKIVDSYLIEVTLLVSVCLGAMVHALRCNSELIAIMSALLANLAIGLSGSSLTSNIAIIVIASLVMFVALKQNWNRLFITLILASYISHVFVSREAYGYSFATQLDIGIATACYLSVFLIIFSLATFFCKENQTNVKPMIIANCLNAVGYSSCLATLSHDYFLKERSLLFGLTGIFYLVLSMPKFRYAIPQLRTTNLLLGLFFVNTAIWMEYSGAWVIIQNLMQIALLVFLGLRYQIKALRWFSLYLAFCFFPLWWHYSDYTRNEQWSTINSIFGIKDPVEVMISLFATLVFGTICWLYCSPIFKNEAGKLETLYYKRIYFCFTNLAASMVPWYLPGESSITYWSIQALLSCYFSVIARELFFAGISTLSGVLALLFLFFSISDWQWPSMLIIIISCFAYYGVMRTKITASDFVFASNSKSAAAFAAIIILTCLVFQKLSTFWLSTGLALEGLLLVGFGLWLKEKFMRISGLIVLSLLVIKLFFFDLGNATSLQKIISFIAAGLVLLGSSYVYMEFTKRLKD